MTNPVIASSPGLSSPPVLTQQAPYYNVEGKNAKNKGEEGLVHFITRLTSQGRKGVERT